MNNSRRNFIKSTAIASTAMGMLPQLTGKIFAANSGLPATDPFSGIQIAAHSLW